MICSLRIESLRSTTTAQARLRSLGRVVPTISHLDAGLRQTIAILEVRR